MIHGAALEGARVLNTELHPSIPPNSSHRHNVGHEVLLFCDLCEIRRVWRIIAFRSEGGNKSEFLPSLMVACRES